MRFLKILFCSIFIAIILCFSVAAESPDLGAPNSTALTYLTGVVREIPFNDDYIIFRLDDYSTVLVYGDLAVSGNTITSDTVHRIEYDTRGYQDGYNYSPTVSRSTVNNYTFTYNQNHILYGNIADFSAVDRGGFYVLRYIFYALIFFVFIWLLFNFISKRWLTVC